MGVAGTSLSSVKFSRMQAWDKWKLLAFSAKVIHLAALSAISQLMAPYSSSSFSSSIEPLSTLRAGFTSSPSRGLLFLTSALGFPLKTGSSPLLKGASWPTEGQSLVLQAVLGGNAMALMGTISVVIGTNQNPDVMIADQYKHLQHCQTCHALLDAQVMQHLPNLAALLFSAGKPDDLKLVTVLHDQLFNDCHSVMPFSTHALS